jgi:hypothetical protein
MNTMNPFSVQIPKLTAWFFLVLVLVSGHLSAAEISVAVDRNPVSIEDSFQITFSANQSPDGEPDFSPLEESFSIRGRSLSNSASIINGKASRSINWILSVQALKAGNLTIPQIKFGNDASKPLAIEVTEANVKNDVKSSPDIFLEVEANPLNPFIQSQILYTLRLFRKIDIVQAQLTEPELPEAVVEKLGEDTTYNTQVKGVSYTVTERKYAIYPQKSGKATIKPLVLNAEVLSGASPAFGGFFNSQTTKTMRVLSREINLEVKPKPAGWGNSPWLPAEQLILKQEFSGDFEQMKVGEPITRTLTVQAMGATVSSIPDLNTVKTNEQLKIYPDQPVLKEQKTSDGLIASREEKIAIIPSKAGKFTLPAIEIPWFNTQSQQTEIAKIPEITLKATGVPAMQTPVAVPASPVASKPNPQYEEITSPAQAKLPESDSNQLWLWVSVFLAVGWLLTVVFFVNRQRSLTSPSPVENQEDLKVRQLVNKLKKACTDNNAIVVKDLLLEWGRRQYAENSLAAIASRCDSELKNEILLLNQVLYAKNADKWQGQNLFKAFGENKTDNKKSSSAEDDKLEPLYRL